MIDFKQILKTNPNGVLATQDRDKVKTRVFQFLFTEENKVYFCTSNRKSVYSQLQENPNVSFCTYAPGFASVLSIDGRVVFVDDKVLKVRALEENPGIKELYQSAENPEFEIFYITPEKIVSFDFKNGKQVVDF